MKLQVIFALGLMMPLMACVSTTPQGAQPAAQANLCAPGKPSPLQGSSADARLFCDVKPAASAKLLLQDGVGECSDASLLRAEIVRPATRVIANGQPLLAWQERWFASVCGQDRHVDVTFVASSQGTQFAVRD